MSIDGVSMRKHRALDIKAAMQDRNYSFEDLTTLCQRTTWMREKTCEALIRDMIRIGWIKGDGKGHFKKV